MTTRVPLRARDGSVRAYALIDDEDAPDILAHTWYLGARGYAMRQIRMSRTKMRAEFIHRRILGLEHGNPLQADHINHDKLDNQRGNLRVVTCAQNNQNITGTRALSGIRGVHWRADRGKWMARIILNRKMYSGGHFDTREEAEQAAIALRRKLHSHAPASLT